MEYLSVVDENNHFTGEFYPREYIHEHNLWHRHVSSWIMNEEGKILLQQRSVHKKKNPGLWGKTGGHIEGEEQPILALMIEVKEELGITLNNEDIIFLDLYKSDGEEHCFSYNFLIMTKKAENEFKLQKEEVSKVKYFRIEELENYRLKEDPRFTFKNWGINNFKENMEMLKKYRLKIVNKK